MYRRETLPVDDRDFEHDESFVLTNFRRPSHELNRILLNSRAFMIFFETINLSPLSLPPVFKRPESVSRQSEPIFARPMSVASVRRKSRKRPKFHRHQVFGLKIINYTQ